MLKNNADMDRACGKNKRRKWLVIGKMRTENKRKYGRPMKTWNNRTAYVLKKKAA